MALSPIEDSYLQRLTSSQFPDMPASEPAMPVDAAALDAPSMDGMQLAAGPSQTVSDAGAGRGSYAGFDPRLDMANKGQQDQMRAYDPTTRERIASFLQAGFEGLGMDRYKARQNAQTLIGGGSSNLPLDMGLADIVPFLGTALQTEEAVNMGGEAVQSAKQGNYGTAALQAGGAVLGLVPGAAGTVKAAKAVAKATKGMPVGMSTQAVGGMDGVLTQTAKATAPVNDMGFYSAVEQAALNIQRKSGTGQAMLNDITKGQDVKLDEVKWIGLDDFLKGKKNVTREEVQQFIAANKVDVQEVQLGGPDANAQRVALQEQRDQLASQVFQQEGSVVINGQKLFNDELGYMLLDGTVKPEQLPADRIAAATKWVDVQSQLDNFTPESSSPSKFGAYTLPGGENYREILLTTPTNMSAYNDYVKTLRAKYGEGGFSNLPLTEAERARLDKFYANEDVQPYKSSHWEQPNVLAHIRVNDRIDADGKKMLLVEEVQSDWHQAGRDKGYRNDVDLQRKFDDLTKQHRAVVARRAEIVTDTDKADEYKSLAKQEQQLIDEMNKLHDTKQYGVPDAPMKDTWYQLALKRVLKYAADNGYERVGLTTGKTNAERFNLAETFDAMNYKKNKDGTFSLAVKPKGEGIFQSDFGGTTLSNIPEKDLPSIVGKELSQKIVAGEGRQAASRKVLEGIDLQVGGEGMKKYYDEVYPQFLAKYGKKWSAKVGETQIKIGADKVEPGISAPGIGVEFPAKTTPAPMEKVRFVDITPEMRQGVGKGQPLFTATGIGAGTTGATMQDKEQK